MSKARALEKEYGQPIRGILVDALNKYGSVEIAAEILGYSDRRIRTLVRKLGISRKWV